MHISGIKGTAGVSAVRVRAHRASVKPELPMGIAKPRPKAPGTDGGLVTIDIDATIVTSCSEKAQAAPTWKKMYASLPLR